MSLYLQIKLLSDTAPGSGAGEPGGIDRSITFKANGLPVIQGRRLKGCLKEAAQEVCEAFTRAGRPDYLSKQHFDELFGLPGKPGAGWLHLKDAHLKQAAELEPWLAWAAGEAGKVFNPASVEDFYSGLRTQTSISRTTGGPVENTLRVTRLLKRGLEFRAEVELRRPIYEPDRPEVETALLEALKLSCAALRHIGLSRNRGPGEVEVKLYQAGQPLELAFNRPSATNTSGD